MNDEAIARIQFMMDEKIIERERLYEEWLVLDAA